MQLRQPLFNCTCVDERLHHYVASTVLFFRSRRRVLPRVRHGYLVCTWCHREVHRTPRFESFARRGTLAGGDGTTRGGGGGGGIIGGGILGAPRRGPAGGMSRRLEPTPTPMQWVFFSGGELAAVEEECPPVEKQADGMEEATEARSHGTSIPSGVVAAAGYSHGHAAVASPFNELLFGNAIQRPFLSKKQNQKNRNPKHADYYSTTTTG